MFFYCLPSSTFHLQLLHWVQLPAPLILLVLLILMCITAFVPFPFSHSYSLWCSHYLSLDKIYYFSYSKLDRTLLLLKQCKTYPPSSNPLCSKSHLCAISILCFLYLITSLFNSSFFFDFLCPAFVLRPVNIKSSTTNTLRYSQPWLQKWLQNGCKNYYLLNRSLPGHQLL